ncbi:MAG: RES family NAD+ phosphorylase [Acidobacteriota bacterium]|nr:RES family NAD+ phosphorylase [Acidobacteriota bacterium]
MPKFPEPPDLRRVPMDAKVLPTGTLLWRVYFRGGRHPTFWDGFRSFGPTRGRFDHQLPPPRVQERAVLYAAGHGPTGLAEVFQDTRVIDRTARDPWLAGFQLAVPLTLLDLAGSWPTRAGASMALSSGARPRAQRWSRAIYEVYPDLAGLYYPSSMAGNRPAVALYERALPGIPRSPIFHRPLVDPALLSLLSRVARDIGYGLV